MGKSPDLGSGVAISAAHRHGPRPRPEPGPATPGLRLQHAEQSAGAVTGVARHRGSRGFFIGKTMGKPCENHGKTMGKPMENGGLMDFEPTNVGRCPKHKINVPNGFLTIFKYSGSWCHRCSSKAIYTNPQKQALEKNTSRTIYDHTAWKNHTCLLSNTHRLSLSKDWFIIVSPIIIIPFTIFEKINQRKPSSSSSCCLRPDVLAREQRYEDRAEKRRRLHPVEWPQPATPAATAPQPALAAPLEVRIFPVFLWGVLLNLGENPKSLTVGFFETWELVEIA